MPVILEKCFLHHHAYGSRCKHGYPKLRLILHYCETRGRRKRVARIATQPKHDFEDRITRNCLPFKSKPMSSPSAPLPSLRECNSAVKWPHSFSSLESIVSFLRKTLTSDLAFSYSVLYLSRGGTRHRFWETIKFQRYDKILHVKPFDSVSLSSIKLSASSSPMVNLRVKVSTHGVDPWFVSTCTS